MSIPKPDPKRCRGALLLTALALVSSGSVACTATRAVLTKDRDRPTVELRGGDLVRYNETGRPVWALEAHTVRYFEGRGETWAEGVVVRFAQAEGEEGLTVRAEQLLFDHQTGDLLLEGDVTASNSEGLRFSTQEARWDEDGQTLRGDGPIRVSRGDLTLEGEGFRYRPGEGLLTVWDARVRVGTGTGR